jgi:hypothetical protein
MAIVQGKFYIDGKKALEGQYSFSLIDGIEMIINVDAESQVINNV